MPEFLPIVISVALNMEISRINLDDLCGMQGKLDEVLKIHCKGLEMTRTIYHNDSVDFDNAASLRNFGW